MPGDIYHSNSAFVIRANHLQIRAEQFFGSRGADAKIAVIILDSGELAVNLRHAGSRGKLQRRFAAKKRARQFRYG